MANEYIKIQVQAIQFLNWSGLIQKVSFWKSLTCTQNDLENEKETEFVDVNPPTPGACGSRCKS